MVRFALRDPDWVHLCDGDAGTPDLRSKFVKGAAAGQNPGATGGSTSYAHSNCAVNDHVALGHSGGAVTRGTSGVTLDQHAALTHAGTAIGDHSAHVHSGSANHTSVSSKQGSSSGNVVTTNTHGNTGNPTATLTHSVTQPNQHGATLLLIQTAERGTTTVSLSPQTTPLYHTI